MAAKRKAKKSPSPKARKRPERATRSGRSASPSPKAGKRSERATRSGRSASKQKVAKKQASKKGIKKASRKPAWIAPKSGKRPERATRSGRSASKPKVAKKQASKKGIKKASRKPAWIAPKSGKRPERATRSGRSASKPKVAKKQVAPKTPKKSVQKQATKKRIRRAPQKPRKQPAWIAAHGETRKAVYTLPSWVKKGRKSKDWVLKEKAKKWDRTHFIVESELTRELWALNRKLEIERRARKGAETRLRKKHGKSQGKFTRTPKDLTDRELAQHIAKIDKLARDVGPEFLESKKYDALVSEQAMRAQKKIFQSFDKKTHRKVKPVGELKWLTPAYRKRVELADRLGLPRRYARGHRLPGEPTLKLAHEALLVAKFHNQKLRERVLRELENVLGKSGDSAKKRRERAQNYIDDLAESPDVLDQY